MRRLLRLLELLARKRAQIAPQHHAHHRAASALVLRHVAQRVSGLHLLVALHAAQRANRATLVDRRVHFFRQRNVADRKRQQFQAHVVHHWLQILFDTLSDFIILRSQIQRGDLQFAQCIREFGDALQLDLLFQFLRLEFALRTDEALQHVVRHADAIGIVAERANAQGAKVRVAHRDRLRGAPLAVQLLRPLDEIHFRLVPRIEAVRQRENRRQNRKVLGFKRIGSRLELVCNLPFVHENGGLTRPYDQFRAAFDFVARPFETVDEHARRLLRPFDDVDQLVLDEIHDAHVCLLVVTDLTSYTIR